MNISVFGLGDVGTVTSVCSAAKGYHIIDIDQHGGNGVFRECFGAIDVIKATSEKCR